VTGADEAASDDHLAPRSRWLGLLGSITFTPVSRFRLLLRKQQGKVQTHAVELLGGEAPPNNASNRSSLPRPGGAVSATELKIACSRHVSSGELKRRPWHFISAGVQSFELNTLSTTAVCECPPFACLHGSKREVRLGRFTPNFPDPVTARI
jgi:hypothetical protein